MKYMPVFRLSVASVLCLAALPLVTPAQQAASADAAATATDQMPRFVGGVKEVITPVIVTGRWFAAVPVSSHG
jgi:hypothetical protein